jgi:hypothetical protein
VLCAGDKARRLAGRYGRCVDITVLAHQGGWDEIALVGGPLIILWGLLVMANRRARRKTKESDT